MDVSGGVEYHSTDELHNAGSAETALWALPVAPKGIDKNYLKWPLSPTTNKILTDEQEQEEDEDDEYGEDTEHIDFSELRKHMHVFRPVSSKSFSLPSNGRYVFYSPLTGLLRHDVLAQVGLSVGIKSSQLGRVMGEAPFWLDICHPKGAEITALSGIFKMHPLTLEDLQGEWEDIQEKCDIFPKYYFICIRACDADAKSEEYMQPITFYILVSPSCVVTLHEEGLEFSQTIARRMRLLTARTGLTSDWIVYTILEEVLEMFNPAVREIEEETDNIDDLVVTALSGYKDDFCDPLEMDLLTRITAVRRRVTKLIRLMSAKSELLRVIAKRCSSRFSDDAHLYLRDLQDHTTMVDQRLQHCDESLNRSHSTYLAHISMDMNQASNKMGKVMKKLIALSTVTLPWTMITMLLGMNIYVPGRTSLESGSLFPFAVLFMIMALLSIFMYMMGRRLQWF